MPDSLATALTFLEHLTRRRFAQAWRLCDTTLKASLPLISLEDSWHEAITLLGRWYDCEAAQSNEYGPYTQHIIYCRFERGTYPWQIAVRDGLISGVKFEMDEAVEEHL